jgi:hypothetical protein
VRGGIDAAGEAGDDGVAAFAEVEREIAGHLLASGRGIAGADNADGALPVEVFAAPDRDQWWRRGNKAEQRGVVRLA